MIVFLDENFPPQLANALDILQKHLNLKNNTSIEVKAIKEYFRQGIPDEEWIPKVGTMKGIVITRDHRIQTTRHQKELCIQHGLGVFFFDLIKGAKYWQIVTFFIERWEDILDKIQNNKTPFAYRYTSRSCSKLDN